MDALLARRALNFEAVVVFEGVGLPSNVLLVTQCASEYLVLVCRCRISILKYKLKRTSSCASSRLLRTAASFFVTHFLTFIYFYLLSFFEVFSHKQNSQKCCAAGRTVRLGENPPLQQGKLIDSTKRHQQRVVRLLLRD